MECRVCSGTDLRLFFTLGKRKQFEYYKCVKCGLVNLDMEGLKHTENQNKYSFKYKDPYDKKKNNGNYQTALFVNKQLKSKGTFLDIGCGNGSLLNFLRESGWKVTGLELTEILAKKVKEVLNIDVLQVNFMELDDFSVKYNALSLRHVLEHLPDSNLAMRKLSSLLLPGGYAILEFPNIEGITYKVRRLTKKMGLHKDPYDEDFVPGHCNEFSKKSFKYLVDQNGFKLIRWESYSSKSYMNIILKLFKVGTKARVLIKKTDA